MIDRTHPKQGVCQFELRSLGWEPADNASTASILQMKRDAKLHWKRIFGNSTKSHIRSGSLGNLGTRQRSWFVGAGTSQSLQSASSSSSVILPSYHPPTVCLPSTDHKSTSHLPCLSNPFSTLADPPPRRVKPASRPRRKRP